MKKSSKVLLAILMLLFGMTYAADAEMISINFEDLTLGASYNTGDTFVSSGITITCKDFQWSNGACTSGGIANVGNNVMAGGSGNEMGVNNINLDFDLSAAAPSVLYLHFGEYGGNINIEINSVLKNVEDFSELNGAGIGDVQITVVNGLGNDKGILRLTGAISQFAIGGQELGIDDITAFADSCSYDDADDDGVIDQWDNCPDTPANSSVYKNGCPPEECYTEEQMNKMVESVLTWGDINGDKKIDLSEAIHALRVTSGVIKSK